MPLLVYSNSRQVESARASYAQRGCVQCEKCAWMRPARHFTRVKLCSCSAIHWSDCPQRCWGSIARERSDCLRSQVTSNQRDAGQRTALLVLCQQACAPHEQTQRSPRVAPSSTLPIAIFAWYSYSLTRTKAVVRYSVLYSRLSG